MSITKCVFTIKFTLFSVFCHCHVRLFAYAKFTKKYKSFPITLRDLFEMYLQRILTCNLEIFVLTIENKVIGWLEYLL